jgi:hypothetical protein
MASGDSSTAAKGGYVNGSATPEPATGDGGQAGAKLHRGDGQAALGEWHGGLPGAAADLDYPVPRPEAGQLDQVAEQPGRTHRPGALVSLGAPVESGSQGVAPRVILHESHGALRRADLLRFST